MRGFAAAPVIFIAMFLISATLFLQFLSMDKQVAEGVGKEGKIVKSSADALKIESENNTAIYLKAKEYASNPENSNTTIETNLETDFEPIYFYVANNTPNIFKITYTLNTKLENLNRNQTYTEIVNVS